MDADDLRAVHQAAIRFSLANVSTRIQQRGLVSVFGSRPPTGRTLSRATTALPAAAQLPEREASQQLQRAGSFVLQLLQLAPLLRDFESARFVERGGPERIFLLRVRLGRGGWPFWLQLRGRRIAANGPQVSICDAVQRA